MKGIKQIKNYRLIKEMGRGATAIVYEAVDDNNNQLVAVKAIPSQKLRDPRVMENFKRELRLLHGLNHKNIVKIKGVEKTVNNIYFILEYCNGGNLLDFMHAYKRVNNSQLPEKIVQKILRQLIEGLQYMHNNRTVHRDIKLENILLNFDESMNQVSAGGLPDKIDYKKVGFENFSIKIADLGYARELEGSGVASTICGTPITMAPDIINLFNGNSNKDNSYNNKVDLWSLGTITYELLIGQPPFYARNYQQLFEEVLNGKYNLPKNIKISVEAITFINGLLQFYPDKRMNWEEINKHPFITEDEKNFTFLDLHTVQSNFKNPEQLEMNTKDCDNFIWLNFKANNIALDKIDQSIYQDPLFQKIKKESVIAFTETQHKISNKASNNYNSNDEVYEDANDDLFIANDQDEVKENKILRESNEKLNRENEDKEKKETDNRVINKLLSEMNRSLGSLKNQDDGKPITNDKLEEIENKNIEKNDEMKLVENQKPNLELIPENNEEETNCLKENSDDISKNEDYGKMRKSDINNQNEEYIGGGEVAPTLDMIVENSNLDKGEEKKIESSSVHNETSEKLNEDENEGNNLGDENKVASMDAIPNKIVNIDNVNEQQQKEGIESILI